jgi:hypothetical protein
MVDPCGLYRPSYETPVWSVCVCVPLLDAAIPTHSNLSGPCVCVCVRVWLCLARRRVTGHPDAPPPHTHTHARVQTQPTTGLDAKTAGKVVEILARLAQEKGKTVVLSIHQVRIRRGGGGGGVGGGERMCKRCVCVCLDDGGGGVYRKEARTDPCRHPPTHLTQHNTHHTTTAQVPDLPALPQAHPPLRGRAGLPGQRRRRRRLL